MHIGNAPSYALVHCGAGALSACRQLIQPPGDELLLGGVTRQLERSAVGVARLVRTTEPAQEIGPDGVQQVVALESIDLVDQRKAVFGAAGLSDRHCSISATTGEGTNARSCS